MNNATVKSVLELVDERPNVDNEELFQNLWSLLGDLRQKMSGRFELVADSSSADLQPYHSLDRSASGHLSTFAGPEIDWLVHSFIGTPKTSFTNMHLTAWLGPQVRVPHFGMALGTMPDIFLYLDYVPRCDLMADLEYLDTYYEAANERHLELARDPRFSPFVSKTLYMRQSQSHASLCFMVKPEGDVVELISRVAHEMVDRWLHWVDIAEPTPAPQRAALAERDLLIRRTIAERDPANAIGARLFGDELTNKLVRTLWGGDRQLPRAAR